ncbi:hypothetical protein Cni_G00682 [Canna indica]|uniref:Transducin/WD40 repeat-like superfamily protein n=1 Tax=Canna indica TaxID=4628 RepID=A0AAQ3JN61_9LILI|nr:hypothetical protein Cni_G00682 [Canna indica]
MDRPQSSERAAVVAIECVAGSSKADEWGGDMLQTGDVVEEIKIGGSAAVRSPFKGGKSGVQKLLHSAFKRGETSIEVRVRRCSKAVELQACIVPHGPAGRRQYVLRSIHDPNYAVGFVDRMESECIALQGSRNSRVVCALSTAKIQDGYVSYNWEKKMKEFLPLSSSSCFLSVLVLPKALDAVGSRYNSFEDTLARANAWLISSQVTGVPIEFINIQTEALLTKISGETASATVNSGSSSDLSNLANASLYGFEDYHGVDIGVVKAVRLWYTPAAGELAIDIKLQEGDTKLGFAISRTEEGFIYISSVDETENESASTRSGLREMFRQARDTSKLLVISRVSNEKVLPWMVSSAGGIRCFDTISLSQKLSLHRHALKPIRIHVLMWEQPLPNELIQYKALSPLSAPFPAPTIERPNLVGADASETGFEDDMVGDVSFRPRWKRMIPELEGKIPLSYRREAFQLLFNSLAEVRVFEHSYKIGPESCPTHMARMANAANPDIPIYSTRSCSCSKTGIYLASVTKSGCLTVHDFETLYCTIYGPKSSLLKDEGKDLLHIHTSQTLDSVRWNPTNQDEVACSSRQIDKVMLFDIGYVSSEPVEVFEKDKSKLSRHACGLYSGLSDILFGSADKSRLLACGLDGIVYIWDKRLSNFPYLELTTNSQSQLNSIAVDSEDRVVFGASKHGIIYAWDLRGGRSSYAFQSHNEGSCPLLASIKLSALLERITTLKAQSNIVSREIHSISLDPSCSHQLAFHLDDGWSGVLNISNLNVTHVHCPPPAWLDGMDISMGSIMRKPSWLPTCSIYAVGSSSDNGLYLLDFYPSTSSACHVDFTEELWSTPGKCSRAGKNKYIPVSQNILVCAVHPLNGTIIAGTKQSSLLVVSPKHRAHKDSNSTT